VKALVKGSGKKHHALAAGQTFEHLSGLDRLNSSGCALVQLIELTELTP
jgi:hypothetical protein